MNQLVVKEEVCFDAILKDVDVMNNMCAALMKTKHYAAMGEAGLFAIVQKAKSLGISPLEALNGGLYYVQGKVGMSTEMMASLIRERGHSISKDPKSDNSICILHGKRKDTGDTWTVSFSMGDATKAGLAKNMYDKYPAIMLYNRAMSTLARQLFPDVIKGAGYTMDELQEIKANSSFSHSEAAQVELREEPKVEWVTAEQGTEIADLLAICDTEYKEKTLKYILGPLKCKSIYELPAHLYERVKAGAVANAKQKASDDTFAQILADSEQMNLELQQLKEKKA